MEIKAAIVEARFSLRIPEEKVKRVAALHDCEDHESLMRALEFEVADDPHSFMQYAHDAPDTEADM